MANLEAIQEQTAQWPQQPVGEVVVPQLADVVTDMELARQQMQYELVEGMFTAITGEEHIVYQQVIAHSQTDGDRTKVNLGYTGGARIRWVTMNSYLGTLPMGERQAEAARVLPDVEKLYELIDISSLPPETIHGGTIHWLGEITGDRMKTFERLGDNEQAQQGLEQAVSDIRKELAQIAEEPHGAKQEYETPDLSLLGVLYNQHGRLTKDQPEILQALNVTRKAHAQQQNTHRLATISIHTIATSLLPGYRGTLASKVSGIKQGTKSFIQAFKEDKAQSINALTQFLSHARDRLKEK